MQRDANVGAAEEHAGETSLMVEGMTCGSCVARVDKALRGVPGVREAAVNLTTGMARVTGAVEEGKLLEAVDRAGYSAKVISAAKGSAETVREVAARGEAHTREVWDRLVVGVMAGVPVVLIDLLMPRLMHNHSVPGLRALAVAQLVMAAVVMGYAGWVFFAGAWRAVRHGSANMDVLVALGTGVAFLYSLVVMALEWASIVPPHRYHNELHAAVVIVVLVTLGKYLEARAKRRASSAVAGLASQSSPTAMRILADGRIETVAAEAIVPGDRVQVLAHQTVPVDGEVVEGTGAADLSVVTGESLPVDVGVGAKLPGGATLADGRVVMRATSTAAASTVARILDLVNAAQASKTQVQGLADRVAGIFVPIVLAIAVLNFLGWLVITGTWERGLLTTIATIVIACPCAMGLATPTAITVALGTAARQGILFTRAAALETARTITTVVFDKTGTLTQGKPVVARVAAAPGMSEEEVLARAASMEQFSEHPLGKAIVAAAAERQVNLLDPASFNSIPGGGIRAAFEGETDREFLACSPTYLQQEGIAAGAQWAQRLEELMREGQSAVVLAELPARRIVGVIALRDALRPDAVAMLQNLQGQAVRVGVLSGDSEAAVRATLKDHAVDFVRAQVRPQEKAAALEAMRKESGSQVIAFVGDGVNDAPALAAADLGIAMATGTDVAKGAGDVLLMSNRLMAVPETLRLARRTMRVIRQNLFWAFAYNVAAIPLAMMGWLSPGMAAGAMMLSSLTVVLNALRLRRT